MINQTLCPICHTLFRVAENTLIESNGMVQCGVCGMVFNALEHWVETTAEHETAPPTSLPPRAEPAFILINAPYIELPSTALATHESYPEPILLTTDAPPFIADKDLPPQLIATGLSLDEPDEAPVEPIDFKNRSRKKPAFFFASLSLLLSLVLLTQLGYFYKDSLAAALPKIKPDLLTICQYLDCSVQLPHDSNLLRINNVDFKMDAQQPTHIHVRLTLENLADSAIAYPDIALTLTNDADETVVKRNFQPVDYIEKKTIISTGIAARTEFVVNLTLDVSHINVSNYKVLLFYPN